MTTFYYGIPHSLLSGTARRRARGTVWNHFSDYIHHPIVRPLLEACRA